jgi:Putative peptidoglycan binding domain
MLLKNYKQQDTKGIEGLSNQLCGEAVKQGFLKRIEGSNIQFDTDSLVHPYLHPNAANSLNSIAVKVAVKYPDKKITLSTCYRTLAQQYILKRNLTTLVAPVGRSDHGSGRGIDLINWGESWWESLNDDWLQTYSPRDLVHWDFTNTPDSRSATVKVFQRLWNANNTRKVAEDGICGRGTLEALGDSPINGFSICDTARFLEIGDKGIDVSKVQAILLAAKLYTGACDGIFGLGTKDAVLDFQRKYISNDSGIVDRITWGRLRDYPDTEPIR